MGTPRRAPGAAARGSVRRGVDEPRGASMSHVDEPGEQLPHRGWTRPAASTFGKWECTRQGVGRDSVPVPSGEPCGRGTGAFEPSHSARRPANGAENENATRQHRWRRLSPWSSASTHSIDLHFQHAPRAGPRPHTRGCAVGRPAQRQGSPSTTLHNPGRFRHFDAVERTEVSPGGNLFRISVWYVKFYGAGLRPQVRAGVRQDVSRHDHGGVQ